MKLYLISIAKGVPGFGGYDVYDSAVVVAESAIGAKKIHPSGNGEKLTGNPEFYSQSWPNLTIQVDADYLGPAKRGLKEGEVICSSFNAG